MKRMTLRWELVAVVLIGVTSIAAVECNRDVTTCITSEDGITCVNGGVQCNDNAVCHCQENTTWSLGCQCFKDGS